ncbi:MAG: hypothetical protein A2X49_05570 [Lentisphaerae bacterium GWF2_52_8]|nr:MAG: hypothetical protein A2X49_05570 [Lentisphaerae bacterium GWF2_52_8]
MSSRHQDELLKKDAWFSGLFGRDSFILNASPEWIEAVSVQNSREAAEFRDLLSGPVFVYAKVPTDSLAAAHFLESFGFRLIDTNVLFDRELPGGPAAPFSPAVRLARPEDREEVMRIARENFIFSRFHLDPMIPRDTANEIKAQWAGNFFNGKRGDAMLIAENEGELAGFCQMLFKDGLATIDLIAVEKKHRRLGLSAALVAAAESHYTKKATRMLVGTQVANIPSMRSYEKAGFRIRDSKYIFHYHNTGQKI